MKPQQEQLGFDFQEVPLEEAREAIRRDTKYSDLIAKLVEALPKMLPGKAFAFGPRNGNLTDKEISTARTAINKGLERASLRWHCYYSRKRKLFLCVPDPGPSVRLPVSERSQRHRPQPTVRPGVPSIETILEVAAKLFDVQKESIVKGREFRSSAVRKVVILVVRNHLGWTNFRIAEFFGLKNSTISYLVKRTAKDLYDELVRALKLTQK